LAEQFFAQLCFVHLPLRKFHRHTMGCCSSASSGASISVAGARRRREGAKPAVVGDGASLVDSTAHERAITELKRLFEGAGANQMGHVGKAELTAALQSGKELPELLKEAGLNDLLDLITQLANHVEEMVSWEDLLEFAQTAAMREMQHVGKGVAVAVAVGEMVVKRLKQLFESIGGDDEGSVSKEELVAKLKEDTEDTDIMNDDSLGRLVGQADINPLWTAVHDLPTKKHGCITWEEFKEHVRSAAVGVEGKESKAEVVLEDAIAPQSCWCCC